ncbi:hypothetical protein BaRGS_00007987 [Batillaria attramentaria]|uniref:Uncharacterized protein n=1 Tax=Batillaria attramentaria TaxID=370345 RepID=A0ABD0LNF7_9CAEN
MRVFIFVAVVALLWGSASGCGRSDKNYRGERPCDKPWNHFADGCSKSIEDGDYFTPACDRHDICYNCGHLYGYSRKACDDGFWNDMGRICSQTGAFGCSIKQSFYHTVVRNHGASSFKTTRLSPSCSESWVQSCLP